MAASGKIIVSLTGLLIAWALLVRAGAPAAPGLEAVPGLVDAATVVPGLAVELKYSGSDNFMGRDVYGDLERCYLQGDAARMLARAAELLRALKPDLRLLAYDCARPASVQQLMWKVVKDTPARAYVANPHTKTGSVHNYGCAVDLTLADARGRPVDMGCAFDFFGKKAQPRHELALRMSGQLSAEQWANRLLLRQVMVGAGFLPIASEWWHFNYKPPERVRRLYPKIP